MMMLMLSLAPQAPLDWPFRGKVRFSSEELAWPSRAFCAVSPPWILGVLPKGTPFTALTSCLSPRCSSGLRTPRLRKTPSSVPNTCSFCLLGTTKPPTMPRDVGFAPPPSLLQRSGVAFSCPQKDRFTKGTQVSFPLAAEGSLLRCSTTGACGESAHQTRSLSCKPKANMLGFEDHTMH